MDNKKQSPTEVVASNVPTPAAPAPHSGPTQTSHQPVCHHAGSQASEAQEKNSSVQPQMYTSNPSQINFAGLLPMVPSSDAAGGVYTCSTSFQQVSSCVTSEVWPSSLETGVKVAIYPFILFKPESVECLVSK